MKTILLAWAVCVSALTAGPSRTVAPEPTKEVRPRPQPAKGKRTFHPLGFLRRLGAAESEFALRLSSLGIRRETDAGLLRALPPPILLPETSTVTLQGRAFDPNAVFWRLPGMIEVKEGSAAEPEVVGDEVADSALCCALDGPDSGK